MATHSCLQDIYVQLSECGTAVPEIKDNTEAIWDNVQYLYDTLQTENRERLKKMKESFQETQRQLDEVIKQSEQQAVENKRFITSLPQIYDNLLLVRQSMNVLFPKLWEIYQSKLNHVNYVDLAQKTPFMRRKNVINKDNGCKFALAVIHRVDLSIEFPVEECESYIRLNDKFHPPIHPIHTSVEKIKNLRENLTVPSQQLLQSYGISPDILKQLELQLEEHVTRN